MSISRTQSLRESEIGRTLGDLTMFRKTTNVGADVQSDTSSQQEKKFADLLGVNDSFDDEDDFGVGQPSNIGHRLYYGGCDRERKKQENLRQERESILMQEMTHLTQRPAITTRAREKPPKGSLFSDHAVEWQKRRDEKCEEMARESRAREESEITGEPLLNARSLSLLEDSGSYQDPVTGWDSHFAKFASRQNASPLPKGMFSPNINANAVRAENDQPIHERLYSDSATRREKMREAAQYRLQKELEDPATGRPYFSPQALRAPSQEHHTPTRSGENSVFEYLHSAGKRGELSRQADPEATFTPKITLKSLELAERAGRRPLYTPGTKEKTPESETRQRASQSQSMPRDSTKVNLDQFFTRTSHSNHSRNARLERLRKEKEERDNSNCTFQPQITKRSVELFEAAHVYGKPMPMDDTHYSEGATATADRRPVQATAPSPPAAGGRGKGSPAAERATPVVPPLATHKASSEQYYQQPAEAAKPPPQQEAPAKKPQPQAQTAAQEKRPQAAAPATAPAQVHQPSAVATAAAPADTSPAPVNPQPEVSGIASSSAGRGPSGGEGHLDQFENQMHAVLDEWRRLEEV